jgi:lipopolysaccharide/colanic/teichoic acid biosynthesis glycosyltransferase
MEGVQRKQPADSDPESSVLREQRPAFEPRRPRLDFATRIGRLAVLFADRTGWLSVVDESVIDTFLSKTNAATPVTGLILKRILDVLLSSLALIILWPLIAAIAIAIKLDSPGPVFYNSARIGKKGRVFRCIKFRTMFVDAERRRAEALHMNERVGLLTRIRDPRITGVGRFLRKYSLDELPQFVNVLRGDMSLVGPRAPIAGEATAYELNHLRRVDMLPGMTGLWQLLARRDPSFDIYIPLDTAYIENWSIWLDIKILIRAARGLLFGS